MGRIDTLIRKCRKRGGDCQCAGQSCEAVRAIAEARKPSLATIAAAEKQLAALHEKSRRLASPLAKLLPGVTLDPPKPGYVPVVLIDTPDGYFGYEDADGEDFVEADWPFDVDHVWPEDCERLGIRVTVV